MTFIFIKSQKLKEESTDDSLNYYKINLNYTISIHIDKYKNKMTSHFPLIPDEAFLFFPKESDMIEYKNG